MIGKLSNDKTQRGVFIYKTLINSTIIKLITSIIHQYLTILQI